MITAKFYKNFFPSAQHHKILQDETFWCVTIMVRLRQRFFSWLKDWNSVSLFPNNLHFSLVINKKKQERQRFTVRRKMFKWLDSIDTKGNEVSKRTLKHLKKQRKASELFFWTFNSEFFFIQCCVFCYARGSFFAMLWNHNTRTILWSFIQKENSLQ